MGVKVVPAGSGHVDGIVGSLDGTERDTAGISQPSLLQIFICCKMVIVWCPVRGADMPGQVAAST